MNMFEQKVADSFDDIVRTYSLTTLSVDEHTVVLLSEHYALEIMYDRDGVKCIYYDISDSKGRGYNLDLFMLHKRREKLNFSDYDENKTDGYLSHSLTLLVSNLRAAATDILSGNKEWTKLYHWPAFYIEPPLLNVVRAHQ